MGMYPLSIISYTDLRHVSVDGRMEYILCLRYLRYLGTLPDVSCGAVRVLRHSTRLASTYLGAQARIVPTEY